jgi:hypothetical protein
MKHIKLLAGLLFLVALVGVTLKTAAIFGPVAAVAAFAVTFFIGANALDTKWQPSARLCTNDISLTGLTEILYQARDMVAREPTGFSQGVMVNGGSEGVSAGGTVTSLRTTEPTLETSYTPAMTPPAAADITTAVESLTLSLYAGVSIPLKGEQFAQLAATVGAELALQQLYKQAIRKMINQMEADIGAAAYKGASRATGTAGTTPFASNHNSINELRQILEDNGCPLDDGDLSLVINSAAGTKLRNLTQLSKVNESGNDSLLRRGELLNISGLSIRVSAGVQAHTKGAGASYVINNGNIAVGSTTISLDGGTVNSTGFKAGDVITVADEPTAGAYVVKTGLTAVAGDIVLNHPGLRGAIVDGKAVTIGNSYTANLGFHKSAIELAMRPPAQPPGGDVGEEIAVLVDEKTGLSFSARLYKGYGMNQIKLMAFYGIKVWKPEFVATLLG